MLSQKQFWLFAPLLVFTSACLFFQCRRVDIDDVAPRTPEFAFPLFSTNLSIRELVEGIVRDSVVGDTLVINPDGTLTLSYAGDVAKKDASDVFVFLQNGLIPVNDTNFVAPIQAPDSVSINRTILKKGTFALIISNTTRDTIRGRFYIPQMSRNGVSFVLPFVVAPNSTRGNQAWNSGPIDIAGQTLASRENKLRFRYEAFSPNGQRIKIPDIVPGLVGGVGVSFSGLEFSYVEGYWGFNNYPLTRDTIEIDINQTNLSGDVQIFDPRITMVVSNSWGFPTRGVIKYLSFISKNGQELPLESTVFTNGSIDFAYPTLQEVGQSKNTVLRFNKSNSNIDKIFNSQPVRLVYEVDGIANAQRDPNLTGFLTDKSVITLRVNVELTMEGSAKNFGADQVLDVDFGSSRDLSLDQIDNAEFKLVVENSTPISTTAQVYFLDSRGVSVIDSLFTRPTPRMILTAAPVNNAGVASGTQRTENLIPMTPTRFERIRESRRVRIKTFFTTADNGSRPVKLLANQRALLKMGLKIKQKQ
jgi:hypothetical protein